MSELVEMTGLVERLNNIWLDDDHERGCEGRNYTCTCGFDEQTWDTAKEAAAEITRLQAENASLRQTIHECANALGNGAYIAPSCSVEFMADLPKEISIVCSDLREQVEKAREALEPFARVADSYEPDEGDDACVAWAHDFTIGSLRRARDARRTTKGGGE